MFYRLTNEEARKNWEEYGNPDGPGATHFGIALPKWIVEKQNSMWVGNSISKQIMCFWVWSYNCHFCFG